VFSPNATLSKWKSLPHSLYRGPHYLLLRLFSGKVLPYCAVVQRSLASIRLPSILQLLGLLYRVRLFQNDGQVMELWELSHHQPVL